MARNYANEYYVENYLILWLEIASTNIYMARNYANEYYVENSLILWLEIMSTNITLKTNRNGPICKSILRILRLFISHKNHIYMVRNNVNEYYVENKPKWPHLYHTNIIFKWLEIPSTNITMKTNRNGPICKLILRWIQTSHLYGYK